MAKYSLALAGGTVQNQTFNPLMTYWSKNTGEPVRIPSQLFCCNNSVLYMQESPVFELSVAKKHVYNLYKSVYQLNNLQYITVDK